MKTLLIVVLLLIAMPSQGFELYAEVGLGWHNQDYDCPEACLDNELFHAAAGVIMPLKNNFEIDTSANHLSGISTTEDGFGFNMVMIKLRKKWQF